MRFLILLLVSLICVNCYAVDLPIINGLDRATSIEEEDGSPSILDCKKIKVSNNSLTDNGDGTGSLATGVTGPTSSTDNAIARWDGTSGNTLQDSSADIDDSGNLNAASYEIGGVTVLNLFSTSSIGVGPTTGAGSGDNYCTFLGIDAGRVSISQDNNTCVGYEAGELSVDDGGNNTFIGYRAGKGAAGLFSPTWNTCVGSSAGLSLTLGDQNVFLGGVAGGTNTVGLDNVYIGYQAGAQSLDGDQNVAIGSYAGWYGDDNKFNIFIGYYSGYGSGTPEPQGDDNVAIGWSTMIGYSSAFDNTVIGYNAGNDITTGDNNIFVGHSAGDNVTTGSNNIIIGYQIDASAIDISNEINIGNKFKFDVIKDDIVFTDDVDIEDATPHLTFRDTTDNTAFQWHLDTADTTYGIYQLWKGTDNGTGFDVNPNKPILWIDTDNVVHHTEVWKSDDLPVQAVKIPAANYPANDDIDNFGFHRYDSTTEESTFYTWVVPTDFQVGAFNVRGHYAFVVENPPASPAGNLNVRMGFEYKKISDGDVFSFASGTSSGYIDETLVEDETAFTMHITTDGHCNTTGWQPHDKILFRFYRDATAPEDTYDDNGGTDDDIWIKNYHLEYKVSSLGSVS